MEIVLAPYEDPSQGLDWPEQTPIILRAITYRVSVVHFLHIRPIQ